jgi:hypothetical protein
MKIPWDNVVPKLALKVFKFENQILQMKSNDKTTN